MTQALKTLQAILNEKSVTSAIYNSKFCDMDIEEIENLLEMAKVINARLKSEYDAPIEIKVLSIEDRYTVMKVDPDQIGQ